jgi:hypothetical protein
MKRKKGKKREKTKKMVERNEKEEWMERKLFF